MLGCVARTTLVFGLASNKVDVGHATLAAATGHNLCRGHMARRVEDHFNDGNEKDGGQGNGTGHGGVVCHPKTPEAWISERNKCRWEQVHKGSCNQNASTKVSNNEEESGRDSESGELGGQKWKCASHEGDEQNDEKGTNMQRQVVVPFIHSARSTC
jgi:hypothetical protein